LDRHGDLHPLSEVFTSAPRKHTLAVAFAPVKGEKPEVIVQKLTELGIDQIIPLAPTRRSVVKWDDARAAKNEERLRKIAREAAMQSRRTWLPTIHFWPCLVAQLPNQAELKSRGSIALWSLGPKVVLRQTNSPPRCQQFRLGNPSCEQKLLQ
jgi:RsmE family RNA methyltransferase